MNNDNPKIFGLGLSKTGTSSLTEALNLLGIRTIHYPSDEVTLNELQSGNYKLSLMREWQGATDISIAPFFPQLDKAFPESKFILTVREKDSWLRSCEQHWELMSEWLENFPEIKRFQDFIGAVVYGSLKFNRDRFSWAYDQHVLAVREYFKNRSSDFLEINICAGEGWDKLGDFLGKEVPDSPFPRANEWMHLVIKAKKSVSDLIPASEKLLLIDQAGFGSSFAPQHQIIPFLEKDGVYWGVPSDDETANSELLRMINEGIQYVAIGFPCFWQLEYFPTFAETLRSQFIVLHDNEAIKIYRLNAKFS